MFTNFLKDTAEQCSHLSRRQLAALAESLLLQIATSKNRQELLRHAALACLLIREGKHEAEEIATENLTFSGN